VTDEERISYLAEDYGAAPGSLDPADAAELDEIRALLADPAMWEVPGQHLEDTVVAAVTGAASRETGDERSDPPAAARRAAGGEPARRARRRPRRSVVAWAAGAAAAAAIAIAIAIGVTSGAGTTATTFTAALSGTSLAPGATGQAMLTQTTAGWHVTLHVSGLPRLDNGRFYQAWLKNAAGILVPIGTFNQSGDVTLWSGVPPTQYPTITVTRQQANGNPASSGQRVLVGHAHRAS
jgi:Anti-sigma-K factor rskA